MAGHDDPRRRAAHLLIPALPARYDPVMSLGVGEEFAGYTVVRRLGAGGMGEVYLAQHPRLPRQDALKLLNASISTDPNFRERFLREADLAARLWHPHIVGVHDRGEDDDRLWIAMDFVDGPDAAELMARKHPAGMPQELVIAIVTALASALDYAHNQGLLHRDVKPANIIITNIDDDEQRRILLTDFGIARDLEDASGLTQTNMTLGTVAYAAPEQLMGEHIDGRADQYALAATAYHLLTGTPMFPQTNPAAVIGHHLSSPPPRLADTRPALAPLDPVLAVALAKSPTDRFARCSDFARALAEQSTGDASGAAPFAPTAAAPITPPPPGPPTGRTRETAASSTPQAAPNPRRRIPAAVWGLVAALGVLAVGLLAFAWNRNKAPSPTAYPPTSISAPSPSRAAPSTVTVSVGPPPTITETVTPTVIVPPSYSEPTRSAVSGWPVTITGTCDEGGSCGVQQRARPYNSAPRLYPNVLRDGATVGIVCATTGDLRNSQGHGSSSVWYQLNNGAYISSVYTTPPRTEIPAC